MFKMYYFLFSFGLFGLSCLLYFGAGVNNKYEDVFEQIWKLSIINWLFSLIIFAISMFI